MVADACTRLLATIILYYNSYILNTLYMSTDDGSEGISLAKWTLNVIKQLI